jgi:hypothetical protein
MCRKQLAVALAVLLAFVACAPCARAQSGRRFPRAGGDKGFVALTDVKSAAPDAGTRTERGRESDLRSPNAKRTAPFVDDDDDENISSDAKLAAFILIGVIVLFGVANATNKPYAPAGSGAPFRRVH